MAGLSPDCGRIAGLNRVGTGRIFVECLSSYQLSWRGKIPGLAGASIFLWPDGETEVVKGFITEHDAAKWIAEHSQANAQLARYRQGSS